MHTFLVINFIVMMVCIARILERRWPIAITPLPEVIDDWKAVSVNLGLTALVAPLTAVCSGVILSTLGQGWIHLPTDGYWYLVSVIILVVFADLYNYTFHRLQHAIPFLWAMHSFHHSANAVTFVTGGRHLWIERVLAGAVLPIMPLLFQIPPDMQLIVSLIYFIPDTCAHLNVRFPMGRMITVVCSPQWHRIHHSVMPEHRDKNFASLLPLWDILFGTAWIPKPDEYPVTGLDPPVRVGVVDSVIWPFRRPVRGLLARFSRRRLPSTGPESKKRTLWDEHWPSTACSIDLPKSRDQKGSVRSGGVDQIGQPLNSIGS